MSVNISSILLKDVNPKIKYSNFTNQYQANKLASPVMNQKIKYQKPNDIKIPVMNINITFKRTNIFYFLIYITKIYKIFDIIFSIYTEFLNIWIF